MWKLLKWDNKISNNVYIRGPFFLIFYISTCNSILDCVTKLWMCYPFYFDVQLERVFIYCLLDVDASLLTETGILFGTAIQYDILSCCRLN